MIAEDLMVGNFVYFGVNIVPIKSIHTESVLKDTTTVYIELNKELSHYCVDISEIEPIILSEEILLKCGFEKKKHSYSDRYILNDFELERQGVNYAYVLWGGEDAPHLTQFIGHCKHLHELQQLYKILTKQELEIKW